MIEGQKTAATVFKSAGICLTIFETAHWPRQNQGAKFGLSGALNAGFVFDEKP